ncbi:hypothetical protein SCP_1503350 [Sparassis crispa]|uniref:F-box domain-containing protein n=1 Tax=Sparassis crispa TaxID=139825 RepID=A0A401H4G6_9APHY|nr:hypothetical protein SCP_1503350 [Sparassis crispa]GBE89327.1 hypothetical protein SCP_1503350 [Sparassis crispa]
MSLMQTLPSELIEGIARAAYDEGENKQDVASLMATCQAFRTPARSVLWESLSSIVPLLKILPERRWKMVQENGRNAFQWKDSWVFDRSLTARLEAYARLVKRFKWNKQRDITIPSLNALLVKWPGVLSNGIFPQLRYLKWEEDEVDDALSSVFLARIPGKKLQMIHLGWSQNAIYLTRPASDTLSHFLTSVVPPRGFRTFECTSAPVGYDGVRTLANMQDLQIAAFWPSIPDSFAPDNPQETEASFSSLRELHINSTVLGALEESLYSITAETLEPLLRISNLQSFILRCSYIKVDTAFLAGLAEACKCLEKLYLYSEKLMPFSCLRTVAQQFPRLISFGCHIDAKNVPEELPQKPDVPSTLGSLSLDVSPISNSELVAEHLAVLFPELERVVHVHKSDGKEALLWKAVETRFVPNRYRREYVPLRV